MKSRIRLAFAKIRSAWMREWSKQVTIKFHISNDILLSYSAGTLDEASGLLVATHLLFVRIVVHATCSADALGGYLLDSLEATPVSPTMMRCGTIAGQKRSNVSRAERSLLDFFKCK